MRQTINNLKDVRLTEKGKRQCYTTGLAMSLTTNDQPKCPKIISEKTCDYKWEMDNFTKWQNEYNAITRIGTSPLRRTVETAALSILHAPKMILLPAARENRTDLNVDCVGHYVPQLKEFVYDEVFNKTLKRNGEGNPEFSISAIWNNTRTTKRGGLKRKICNVIKEMHGS